MSRFQITVKFCTNSICRYRHSFLGHFMLEFIGTVLIHKKRQKKSLVVSKTVQPVQVFFTIYLTINLII
jgi:hypothetical protein